MATVGRRLPFRPGAGSSFGLAFCKRELGCEPGESRRETDAKREGIAAAKWQCRVARGKRWAHIQMQRREAAPGGKKGSRLEGVDGHAEILEMRRQQLVAELKTRELEPEQLLAKERRLAGELGEAPSVPAEVRDEER